MFGDLTGGISFLCFPLEWSSRLHCLSPLLTKEKKHFPIVSYMPCLSLYKWAKPVFCSTLFLYWEVCSSLREILRPPFKGK